MPQVNQQRLVEHFMSLVKIDSESRNEKEMAETISEQLGQLGFEVRKQPVTEDISNGFNVYGKLKGTLDGSVLVSSHLDTVTPGNGIVPIEENGIIRSAGDTILGGDDKSGIAALFEAVRTLQENDLPIKLSKSLLLFTKKVDFMVQDSSNLIVSSLSMPLYWILVVPLAPSLQRHLVSKI